MEPQAAQTEDLPREGPPSPGEPAEARRVYARLYDDAEEAEFGAPQSRQGTADQRLRGHRLYPRRGAQSARALGGHDPWRPRQGSARRPLPHPARRARHPGGQGPQAAPLEIRRQASEVTQSEGHPRASASETRDSRREQVHGRVSSAKTKRELGDVT